MDKPSIASEIARRAHQLSGMFLTFVLSGEGPEVVGSWQVLHDPKAVGYRNFIHFRDRLQWPELQSVAIFLGASAMLGLLTFIHRFQRRTKGGKWEL